MPMKAARLRSSGYRLHGWLVASGSLVAGAALLLLSLIPDPPSESAGLSEWVEAHGQLLSGSDELLFFAVVCWGAGARGLFRGRRAGTSVLVDIGFAGLAVACLALVVLLLVVGRLVYPVFGIHLSPAVLALLVSSVFGAVHLALLGFAVAAAALSGSTSSGWIGRLVGLASAAAFVAGSFPWLTPGWWDALVAVLLAAWGVFLGVATSRPGEAHPGARSR
jgi:hypothetical protein